MDCFCGGLWDGERETPSGDRGFEVVVRRMEFRDRDDGIIKVFRYL